jgi:hypothetical protein
VLRAACFPRDGREGISISDCRISNLKIDTDGKITLDLRLACTEDDSDGNESSDDDMDMKDSRRIADPTEALDGYDHFMTALRKCGSQDIIAKFEDENISQVVPFALNRLWTGRRMVTVTCGDSTLGAEFNDINEDYANEEMMVKSGEMTLQPLSGAVPLATTRALSVLDPNSD